MSPKKPKSIPIDDGDAASELEKRVDQMLDPSLPDEPVTPSAPEVIPPAPKPTKAKTPPKKSTKIAISQSDDIPTNTAPEVPAPPPKKTKKAIAVAIAADDPAPAEPPAKKNAKIKVVDRSGELPVETPSPEDVAALAESVAAPTVIDTAPELPASKPQKVTVSEPAEETTDSTGPDPELSVDVAGSISEVPSAPELSDDLKEAIGEMAVEAEIAPPTPVPQQPRPSLSTSKPDIVPVRPSADGMPLDRNTTIEQAMADDFDTPDIAKAVDQIVAAESDKVLEAQDLEDEIVNADIDRPGFGARVRGFFADIWHNPITRWGGVLLVLMVIAGAAIWPTSRYLLLNKAGVQASASVQILDQSTYQPLRGVTVKLAGKSVVTDDRGKATLAGLRLGPTLLSVEKTAFAPISEEVVLGWGSNPLSSRSISPVGSQYSFMVTDFLSGKPVADAQASAAEVGADAQADDKGEIKLTLDHNQTGKTIEVAIGAVGYRTEKVTLNLDSKQQATLKLVPSRPVVFVSKRSGKYDIYKVDADGKNEQLVLAGTGSEREDMILAPHPKDNIVAVVSTRDNKRNKDGYLLSSLTIINLWDNSVRSVTQSEQISVVGWSGDRLVYVQIAAGTSAANPNRQRLMGYDYKQSDNKQLATTNYFNDVMLAAGKVFYAPSSTFQAPGVVTALYRVNPDGTNKQALIAQETWNIFRGNYEELQFSAPGQWYNYRLSDPAPTKLETQPANQTSRVYVDSPDGKTSVWVDTRDGKGVLIAYDTAAKTETTLQTKSGLKLPVQWLNNRTLVYRISTDQETADYALSLDGGAPVKVRDVTATGGVDKWYYY